MIESEKKIHVLKEIRLSKASYDYLTDFEVPTYGQDIASKIDYIISDYKRREENLNTAYKQKRFEFAKLSGDILILESQITLAQKALARIDSVNAAINNCNLTMEELDQSLKAYMENHLMEGVAYDG